MPRTYNQGCLIAKTLDLLGERWTLLIVRDLLQGERRFQDFQDSLCGISPNILSARLKLLDEHGLVQRRLYSTHPPRCAYTLTDKGRALEEAIRALWDWGNRYLDEADACACAHAADDAPDAADDAADAPQPRHATVTVWARRASADPGRDATCGPQLVLRVRVSRCDGRAPDAQPQLAALHAAPDCCEVRCNDAA